MKSILYFIIGVTLLSGALYAESIEIANGSFEEGTFELPPTHAYSEKIREAGWVVDEPLLQPAGWCITPVPEFVGEFHLIDDSTQSHTGERAVFLKGHLIYESSLEAKGGEELVVTFWARSDTFSKVSVKYYLYGTDDDGESVWLDEFKEAPVFTTERDWEQYASKVKLPTLVLGKKITSVKIVLFSESGAFFDDISLSLAGSEQTKS